MKTPMTEYRKMQAFLCALELDRVMPLARKELRQGDLGPACKLRDQLTDQYWLYETGKKER